jgi:general stress protein YciG
MSKSKKKQKRGFAVMSPDQKSEIARQGGLAVSRNSRHMADIGRLGGEASARAKRRLKKVKKSR